jgi:ketosteroid isomerase-like protein
MSPQAVANVELVEAMMGLVERNEQQPLAELVDEHAHPDVEWTPLIAVAIEGVYRGRDGVRRFFEDLLDSFEVRYHELEFRQFGDDVVLALCRMDLRGRESGVETSTHAGTVYEFKDGQLRRGRVYDDHAEAVSAAEALASNEDVDA